MSLNRLFFFSEVTPKKLSIVRLQVHYQNPQPMKSIMLNIREYVVCSNLLERLRKACRLKIKGLFLVITYVKMYCNLVAISTASWLRAFFCVLSLALLLVGLPGHLLHHVGALLPGHGDTLPASSIGTFLLVHVLGHGGGSVLTDLLSSVTAHLARSVYIIANLRQRKIKLFKII